MESAAFTAMKIRAMIKLIGEDGWYLDRTRGSSANIGMIRKRCGH
jgi:predicted RNA binding protein YcfA (HicA-like mRNA interferase family)